VLLPARPRPPCSYVAPQAGWICLEAAVLATGRHVLCWRRRGRQAEIAIDEKGVGRIELGRWLRHAYVGSANIWLGGEPFCRISLPVFRSEPQRRDCTGRITFATDQAIIKFVISPREENSLTEALGPVLAWAWSRIRHAPVPVRAGRCDRVDTIFYPSDRDRLTMLSDAQRMILLAFAVWPWALYKGGGT
jgi:hypothetical protein